MKFAVRDWHSHRLFAQSLVGTTSAFVIAASCWAAEPQMADFAEGVELNVSQDRPLIELPLPDRVYTTVTHWDLADLRVFDAKGMVVPHAFCPAPAANGTLITKDIPVYSAAAGDENSSNASVATFTSTDGAQLKIAGDNDNALRSGTSFILDARSVDQALHALQLDWSAPDNAVDIAVRVLASQDLSEWQTVVPTAKLIHAKVAYGSRATPQQLEQQRIALPAAKYQYLRVEPVAKGTGFIIDHASAEYLIPAAPSEPTWFSAGAPHAADEGSGLVYESDHHVPVSYLRILPSTANSRLHVTVQSRAQTNAPWQTQWSGEVYSLRSDNEERATAPIKIVATSSPYWRLLFPSESEAPISAPKFDLGYLPLRLRFLAQGTGPYTLAYGSSRAIKSSAVPCGGLLPSSNASNRDDVIGGASIGEVRTLAGSSVLHSGTELPMRKLVLWGLLLAAIAIVVSISVSQLKRSRKSEE